MSHWRWGGSELKKMTPGPSVQEMPFRPMYNHKMRYCFKQLNLPVIQLVSAENKVGLRANLVLHQHFGLWKCKIYACSAVKMSTKYCQITPVFIEKRNIDHIFEIRQATVWGSINATICALGKCSFRKQPSDCVEKIGTTPAVIIPCDEPDWKVVLTTDFGFSNTNWKIWWTTLTCPSVWVRATELHHWPSQLLPPYRTD